MVPDHPKFVRKLNITWSKFVSLKNQTWVFSRTTFIEVVERVLIIFIEKIWIIVFNDGKL